MAGMDKMGQKRQAKGKSGASERLAHFGRGRKAVDFDWGCFSRVEFAAALGTLAGSGAAIMVGGASGGRGAVISIYIDGDKDRRYLDNGEDFLDWCYDVYEAFGSESEDLYAAWNITRPEDR